MHTYNNLYEQLCSYENLELAFKKARKHKTLKPYVIEFEAALEDNILQLQKELLSQEYMPRPLETFTVRDPKTRKISKSDFRDRVVHHALCNIIEPIFDRTFIHDSYANRVGKGTLKAIERFDCFKRKATKNDMINYFILKADIKHYFDTVDHNMLISIIGRKIRDDKIISLIKIILKNHKTKIMGKGMPLGNLTSQFFANLYLNELDYYVKHFLRIKYYIRYVDDFIIMHISKMQLAEYKELINAFLISVLGLQLHPDKSKIFSMRQGTCFLGLRIFISHKLLKRSNIIKFKNKLSMLCEKYDSKEIFYDEIYDFLEGWAAYSNLADTYNLRKRLFLPIAEKFAGEVSIKEYNRHMKAMHLAITL